MSKHDRRSYFRVKEILPVKLVIRDEDTRKQKIFKGEAIDIGLAGLSITTDEVLPNIDKGIIETNLPVPFNSMKARIKIKWRDSDKRHYGIEFASAPENQLANWEKFIKEFGSRIPDRRQKETHRRSDRNSRNSEEEKRQMLRRIADVWEMSGSDTVKRSLMTREDLIPSQKDIDYTSDAAKARREWLSIKTGINLKHISMYSENPLNLQGNVENFIGVSQVPIGVAGPLKINGQFAKGDFYVPMATTEGALVYTYTLGMQLLHMSGGASVRVLKDETHISPLFTFDSAEQGYQFCNWLDANFNLVKKYAELTTKHGKLLRLHPIHYDKNVTVKFCYSTGDAMGLNMINFATEAACKFIIPIVKPKRFYLRSNFSSVKKVSAHNFSDGMGKTVIAEAMIPAKIVKRVFDVTPNEIVRYFQSAILSSVHAGQVGNNGHVANGMTAIFIACGQDVASIVDSQNAITNFELTDEGDLYVSVKLPTLVIGTVGGGTDIGTQRECLELIGCYGPGKVERFAEVIGAASLAGEITVCANVANGKFAKAHRTYGRKHKGKEFK